MVLERCGGGYCWSYGIWRKESDLYLLDFAWNGGWAQYYVGSVEEAKDLIPGLINVAIGNQSEWPI